jgi:hypothetical protein
MLLLDRDRDFLIMESIQIIITIRTTMDQVGAMSTYKADLRMMDSIENLSNLFLTMQIIIMVNLPFIQILLTPPIPIEEPTTSISINTPLEIVIKAGPYAELN